MATVHSYARFSDPKQAKGDSERRQDELLQKFVESGKHTLSDLQYIDKGKSGFKGDKQKLLNEFLKIMRSRDGRIKPGDILFVEAVDRLSRKGIRPTQDVVNEIFKHGIDIRITSPVEKTYRADAVNDLGDSIELAAFAFAAHTYSALLSGRIKSFHSEARKKAYEGEVINSGAPPSWLQRSKDGFKFLPHAKEIIQFIYQSTIDGLGGRTLTRVCNQKFPAFGKSGKWNLTFIRALIVDRRAMGEMQPHVTDDTGKRIPTGEPIPNYFPAAVDEQTWQRAQQASENRLVERGPSGDFVNLFTGLVQSAWDKCPMSIWTYQQRLADGTKTIHRRLKSRNAVDGITGSNVESLRLSDFEHAVLRVLKELDVSVFNSIPSKALELAAMVKTLKTKEARISEIEADETTSVSLLTKQLIKLKDDAVTIKKEIDKLKTAQTNSSADSLDHIRFLSELDNTPENRQKLREAIKRVVRTIIVMTVKLGDQRKSPVGSLIEIELVSGARRQVMQLAERISPTMSDIKPTTDSLLAMNNDALVKRSKAVKGWLQNAKAKANH